MKKLLTFILTIACLVAFGTQTVFASSLSFKKGEVKDSFALINGVDYEKFSATSVNDEGVSGSQQVNMVTVSPMSGAKVVTWAIPNVNGIKASTVMQMALDYEAKHPEYMVIAAINDDYFGSDSITKVFQMRNQSVVDGVVYRDTSMYNNMYCVGVDDNLGYKIAARGEKLPTTEKYVLDIYDVNGLTIVKSIELDGFNVAPEANQTTVCYGLSESISSSVAEIFNIDATSKSRLTSYFYIAGKASGRTDKTNSEIPAVLTTDVEIANYLDSGCQVRISKKIAGDWANYKSVFGAGAQTLRDGELLTAEEIGDYGLDHVKLRHPRTTIGFKADGSCVLMVIDGRQDGMDGVSERENALALQQLGCVDAFNLDGGGSSTFIIRKNGVLTVVNSPSDGSERSDANCVLVVAPRTNIDINATSKENADGTATISGTASIEALNGFSYESSEIYINGMPTGQSAESFEIAGLQTGRTYNLSVMLIYKSGASNVGKCFYNENIEVGGKESDKLQTPTINGLTVEKQARGFKVNISVSDPSFAITKMNVIYNDGKTSTVARRVAGGYSITIFNDTAKEYNFSLEYSYRTEINNPVDELLENALIYRHNMEEEPHEHEFVDGKCECGEVDPNWEAPHEHEFVNGKCECGEVDPNWEAPHEHEFVNGKCECGEIDPEHEHEYVDGECECGEKEPTEGKPQNPNNGVGMNCSMGFVALLPLIGAAALLLIKRRK